MFKRITPEQVRSRCLDIAVRTRAFTDGEIDVLWEVLEEWAESSGRSYRINLDLDEKGEIDGFIIYGRIPMSRFAWDIYWIVVSPESQGQGKGMAMMDRVEQTVLQAAERAILRIETSGRRDYGPQRRFYEACGYTVSGRIEDFYAPGDALVTYVKNVTSK